MAKEAVQRGRWVVLGAAALVCALAASLLLWLGAEPARAPSAPHLRSEVVSAASPLPPTTTPSVLPAAAPTPAARAPAPAAPSYYPSDPAKLVRALEPLQRETTAGLASVAESSGCDLRNVLVLVTLETRDGDVMIADATASGRAPEIEASEHIAIDPNSIPVDPAVARCVAEHMKNQTFHAQSARPGRRWQLTYDSALRLR